MFFLTQEFPSFLWKQSQTFVLSCFSSLIFCLHVFHCDDQVCSLKKFHVKRNKPKDKDKVKSLFRRALCKISHPVFPVMAVPSLSLLFIFTWCFNDLCISHNILPMTKAFYSSEKEKSIMQDKWFNSLKTNAASMSSHDAIFIFISSHVSSQQWMTCCKQRDVRMGTPGSRKIS